MMEQMLHKTSEADIIKQLLKEDRKLWERLCTEQVSDRAEEMCCGWKAVRPSATYDLTRPPRRKKAPAATALYTASTVSVRSRNDDSDGKRPNMSGELDENCSYIYKGGLSSRADTGNDAAAASRPSPQPQRHVQTVTLEPSTANYTSANALVNCRDELSRILALQLKPELLVEQLIIENRLRTMSLAAFPVLEGREESRLKESDSSRYSHSTPALLPNTHVNYQYRRAPCHGGLGRRVRAHSHKPPETRQAPKAKPHHLHWCKSLSSHSNSQHGDLQIVPSNSQPPSCSPQLQFCDQVTYSRVSCSSKYPPIPQAAYNSPDPSQSQHYRLPVIAPSLPSRIAVDRTKLPHTLLYKSNRQSDGDGHFKSNSLSRESSFYYPHVNYYNSKPMKFK